MVASMALRNDIDDRSSSTGSIHTEFLVGTGRVKRAGQRDDYSVLCVCCSNTFQVLAVSGASSFSSGKASLYWLAKTLLCRFPRA